MWYQPAQRKGDENTGFKYFVYCLLAVIKLSANLPLETAWIKLSMSTFQPAVCQNKSKTMARASISSQSLLNLQLVQLAEIKTLVETAVSMLIKTQMFLCECICNLIFSFFPPEKSSLSLSVSCHFFCCPFSVKVCLLSQLQVRWGWLPLELYSSLTRNLRSSTGEAWLLVLDFSRLKLGPAGALFTSAVCVTYVCVSVGLAWWLWIGWCILCC